MTGVLAVLDLFGVAVFAASGALVAARKDMDVVGFAFVGTVTGIGGGTFRDLLLGIEPVFWVAAPRYVAITIAAAVATYFFVPRIESRMTALLWADALGMSVASVIGAELALAQGVAPFIAVIMGMLTATFGGVVRDVVCGELPLILRREIYATAALAGALLLTISRLAGLDAAPASALGVSAAFIIRGAAIRFELAFPTYRSRKAKDRP